MKSIVTLIHEYEHSDEYNFELCKEICKAAGMEKEWEQADGESFEKVVEKAVSYLKERWM